MAHQFDGESVTLSCIEVLGCAKEHARAFDEERLSARKLALIPSEFGPSVLLPVPCHD